MISIFDLFSIGIGPSSSHTVGPMKAAQQFAQSLAAQGLLPQTANIRVELYGSLALTGHGHGTPPAVLLGLEGHNPKTVDPDHIQPRFQAIQDQQQLLLNGNTPIAYSHQRDFHCYRKEFLPEHSNGLRISAYAANGELILQQIYYSIGGGFIATPETIGKAETSHNVPYPFTNAKSLLQICEQNQLSISDIMLANEQALHPDWDIHAKILEIITTMQACIERGCHITGILPGGLNVKRRAAGIWMKLNENIQQRQDYLPWLNMYAMAVNEENAAGGRVVTAPTNGAAGVLPAVLNYYLEFIPGADYAGAAKFLLTAGAIAILCKKNASISGAEVGCQGEVGSAASMAAAGLTAVLNGTSAQIENAAEIAMEHHLGMTCDPIGGLVQIPCIERNGMGAVKAVNAARIAMLGDGDHFVSLDKVIATMLQTGKDMQMIYKETSLGGLAANIPEC